ncbi:MAG: hypothetical protein NWF07_01175 [Candidatus Bathyarchaeota archaeon]|nr:hypothetical protein [Candidatus Bathyarchaeota archaeon]
MLTTDTKKLSLIAILTATAIATNYLLIGTINVKFMDLIVFTSGYLTGSTLGAVTGILVWLVYGTLNPYGFSLPVLLATMIGEALFGLAGGLYRGSERGTGGVDFWAGFTAFILTFVYDVFTNIVSGLTAGLPISVALVTGIPFMFAHVLSNTVFFGLGFKPLTNSIHKVLGDQNG